VVKKQCDELVSIPMIGPIDSMNASVAAGILFYEVVRQRREVMGEDSRSRDK
jgi:23S rRNA (guanosine2251-2'-O)-methyltransferase